MSRKKRKKNALLLHDLASALNACEKNNIHVKLRHGIIFSDAGYVLPVKDRWVARTLRQLRK
jgi:hypothetical protein